MKIFRAVIAGILAGAALFFLPFFILRGFLFILFIGFIIRLFVVGRFRRGGFGGQSFHPRFADKIRSMSDDEYNKFKQNFYHGRGRYYGDSNKPETIIPID